MLAISDEESSEELSVSEMSTETDWGNFSDYSLVAQRLDRDGDDKGVPLVPLNPDFCIDDVVTKDTDNVLLFFRSRIGANNARKLNTLFRQDKIHHLTVSMLIAPSDDLWRKFADDWKEEQSQFYKSTKSLAVLELSPTNLKQLIKLKSLTHLHVTTSYNQGAGTLMALGRRLAKKVSRKLQHLSSVTVRGALCIDQDGTYMFYTAIAQNKSVVHFELRTDVESFNSHENKRVICKALLKNRNLISLSWLVELSEKNVNKLKLHVENNRRVLYDRVSSVREVLVENETSIANDVIELIVLFTFHQLCLPSHVKSPVFSISTDEKYYNLDAPEGTTFCSLKDL